jgi:hypothetical protein
MAGEQNSKDALRANGAHGQRGRHSRIHPTAEPDDEAIGTGSF